MEQVLHLSRQVMDTRGGVLDELMDQVFDVSILVDDRCRILYISQRSFQVLSQRQDLLGRHVSVVDKVSPFEQVLKTGRPITGLLLELNGRRSVSNLFPIVDGGKVIGVLGAILYRSLSAVKQMFSQLQDSQDEVGQLYQNLARLDSGYTFDDYVGGSPLVKDMLDKCRRAAGSDYPVLLIGETGTGKEIVASGIHSARHDRRFAPYVTINCTAIPDNLLESELFGYEKGAFTGAAADKAGKFELAAEGDLLLDEVGDMELQMQSKLLRVLESREFERVGGRKHLPLRAGVIAATNKNLLKRSAEGRFRADLYYRLSTLEIYLPALRQHTEDIPLLVDHFVAGKGGRLRFTAPAMALLKAYPWPGNVRQLRNLIHRFLVFYDGGEISADLVERELSIGQSNYNEAFGVPAPEPVPAAGTLEELERKAVGKAMEACGGNVTQAARRLGISRAALYQKLKKYQGQ